ncbi:MAG: class I SAM-dependent methyltransferase [Ignavibacteriaceae bacterium]|jgi:2-polyprenyl-3-methyl-5-hydroxy-6-metoxy-1,4-benzoquinol methylase
MESDFRKELYKKYDSAFKIHISDFDEKSIRKYWKWNDIKYLPLISGFSKNVKILELGCGRGYLLEYLRKHGFKNLKGIDISEEQINIAKKKGFDVKVFDAINFLNGSKEKFKVIFALDFIEHFHKTELIQLFEGIFNNLEDGGLFIFHTPNGQTILSPNLIYGDLTHLTIFTPNSALQILKVVGFDKIAFIETGPTRKNLNGLMRLILWKIIKFGNNIKRLVETGSTEKILTQNFIGVAQK